MASFRFRQRQVADPRAQENFEQLESELTVEAVHSVGATGEPAFQNGWANFDTRVARFYKRGERVYLAGVVKSGTIGTAIFTLPVGYRPDLGSAFAIDSNGAFGVIDVLTNGNVQLTIGNNAYAFLDGLSFRAA
jgi:hypothetical protein